MFLQTVTLVALAVLQVTKCDHGNIDDSLNINARWTLEQGGLSGISGLGLVIVSPTLALILDKTENPTSFDSHPA